VKTESEGGKDYVTQLIETHDIHSLEEAKATIIDSGDIRQMLNLQVD
jgi:hypothetical protein